MGGIAANSNRITAMGIGSAHAEAVEATHQNPVENRQHTDGVRTDVNDN